MVRLLLFVLYLCVAAIPAMAQTTAVSRPPNNLGLVAYWNFNEATSTIATDFSGNGFNGTLSTAGSGLPVWVPGKRATAIEFDGTDDYVSVGNVSGTIFSISFWMRADATVSRKIINIDGTDQIELNGSSEVTPTSFPGTTVVYVDASTASATVDTGWHHVVITDTSGVTGATFEMGRVASGYFDGRLDEVRLYSRVLSPTEVAYLYGVGLARSGAQRINASSVTLANGTTLGPAHGLVGHWTFDGGDFVRTVSDSSGNGNHGYVVNTATTTAKTIGKLGQAIVLDGTNDLVNAGSGATLDNLSAITACAWVYQRADPPDSYDMVFDKTSTGADGWELYISAPSGGFGFQNTLNDTKEATIATNRLNAWHHLCGVWTGADGHAAITLYLDGADAGVTTTSSAAGTNNDAANSLGIGGGVAVGLTQNGFIDDARIYNRALSASEIKQLYQLGQVRVVP